VLVSGPSRWCKLLSSMPPLAIEPYNLIWKVVLGRSYRKNDTTPRVSHVFGDQSCDITVG
jgi:hypothetical protein